MHKQNLIGEIFIYPYSAQTEPSGGNIHLPVFWTNRTPRGKYSSNHTLDKENSKGESIHLPVLRTNRTPQVKHSSTRFLNKQNLQKKHSSTRIQNKQNPAWAIFIYPYSKQANPHIGNIHLPLLWTNSTPRRKRFHLTVFWTNKTPRGKRSSTRILDKQNPKRETFIYPYSK